MEIVSFPVKFQRRNTYLIAYIYDQYIPYYFLLILLNIVWKIIVIARKCKSIK